MELERQRASSIPVPDERVVQYQQDATINDTTSARRNITTQASDTTSYKSYEPPQTNQQMEDVASEPPITSLGLEEGT